MTAVGDAHTTLAVHSRSFALAGRLLPRALRDEAAVIYAWCRRGDDAIDRAPPALRAQALARLRTELDDIYEPEPADDPLTAAFQQVVRRHQIPRGWPEELIEGFAMDVARRRYRTLPDLLVYCFRVAGTVGLMMARLMGVRDPAVLRHAIDLGMAMQLTNICRDVGEDWQDGRLYLPLELIGGCDPSALDGEIAAGAARSLLDTADGLYRSGDAGLRALPFRCAVAIRTARLVYSAIGGVIARRRFDVLAGRAVVPGWRKALLAMTALLREAARRAR
jgi:15-cis-phytoene synthase